MIPRFKLCFLFLLCCASLEAVGQKQLQDVIPYAHKQKIRKEDGSYQVITFSKEKKIRFVDPTRRYYWVEKDSVYSTQGAYRGKLLDGSYEELYANKSPKIKGQFVGGLKDGEWRYLDPDGALRRTAVWSRGEESGTYRLYDRQGSLLERGRLRKGLKEGRMVRYHPSDSVERSYTIYKGGEEVIDRKRWTDKARDFLRFKKSNP